MAKSYPYNPGQKTPWPDHPNTKESFGQIIPKNFKGHFPEFKFYTKELFSQNTVDFVACIKGVAKGGNFQNIKNKYVFNKRTRVCVN